MSTGISLNTGGSNVSNPQSGLLGGPKLASNPFGNPNQGLIGSINTATGLQKPQGGESIAPQSTGAQPDFNASNGYGTAGILKPTVTHTTAPDGTHTTTITPDTGTNTNTAPTSSAPGTNFQENLGNIQTASTPNSAYENSINQAKEIQSGIIAPVTQALNQASTAGYSMGGASLGQNNAAVENAPTIGGTQSNLNGELALLNTQGGAQLAGAGAAEQGDVQAAQQELAGSQLQTQGAENIAGLTAPQPYGITTTPYNPGSNTFGTLPSGAAGPAGAGAAEAQVGQGNTVQVQTGNQEQAQALTQQLTQAINQSGFNSLSGGLTTQALNGINQWVKNQSGDPQYQNAYNLIGEIASKYSNILNASGGTPTDVSTTTHNIINGLASGKSIQKVIGDLDANATQSIKALSLAARTNAVSSPSANSGLYNF